MTSLLISSRRLPCTQLHPQASMTNDQGTVYASIILKLLFLEVVKDAAL